MEIPLQVSFRHLPYSQFIATAVRKKAKHLEKFFPRITAMRVLIEPLERRRNQGNLFHVRIDMTVPGRNIIVNRESGDNHAHEDVYVAIRDAFDAAKRQLEDYVRLHFRGRERQRQFELKPTHGKVVRLFPNEDCGFLLTLEGREIFFHKNSVLNQRFEELKIGDEVRFVEARGDKGPQASTVVPIGRCGRHANPAQLA